MASLISFVLIILTSTVCSAHSSHSIPALFWSPESSMNLLPEVHGLVKTDDFLHSYLTPLMHKTSESAVIFLQDKLHVDYFTKHADVYSLEGDGGAFKNIKKLMEGNFSLELPEVVNPYHAVEEMKASFPGDVITVKSAKELEDVKFSEEGKILLIVELNPVSDHKDLESAIGQNDATIGAVSEHLQKRNIKYNALFTGQSASDEQVSNIESHSNRHLLAEVQNTTFNGTFLNVSNGHIFIFLREAIINFTLDGTVWLFNLPVQQGIADKSEYENTSAQIRLDFITSAHPFVNQTYSVSIVTHANYTGDRWTMSMRLHINGGSPDDKSNISIADAVLVPIYDMDFTIPIIYSWHCTDMQMKLDTNRDKGLKIFTNSMIRLTGYQLQPFNIQRDRFFDAQDCVSYFTTPIWMFLFSSIFLLSILLFGVLMVLSLSTMDKYDDPKGKTITVAQSTD